MRIYTKTGDAGETSFFDNTRVSKADSRVDAYGEVGADRGLPEAPQGKFGIPIAQSFTRSVIPKELQLQCALGERSGRRKSAPEENCGTWRNLDLTPSGESGGNAHERGDVHMGVWIAVLVVAIVVVGFALRRGSSRHIDAGQVSESWLQEQRAEKQDRVPQ